MNIFGHLIVGTIQSVFTGSILPLIGSLLPDAVLVSNEVQNRRKGQHFDENKVDNITYFLYMFTHSLSFAFLVCYFSPLLSFGIIVHQLIDWYTHTNKFRTMPLFPFSFKQIGVKINDKKALLISGGYDSVAILEMINREQYDYFFINYAQSYSKEEEKAIKAVSKYYKIEIKKIEDKQWGTDIKNRNFLMINLMQELGYDTISVGSRNILPIFDKYKDSNYVSLKMYALINRIVIETPLTLLTKKQIINKIPKDLIDKLYTTEK
jgi:7-cyano-7-deazaguanine synthase in queuosine biosynthesis